LNRARRHPEVVAAQENGSNGHSRFRRVWLVWAAAGAAGVCVLVVFIRGVTTNEAQQSLCEKLDRLVVKIETAVKVDPELTPAAKRARIMFWEDFRNDPPTCRTTEP